jgi:hypothetical protein
MGILVERVYRDTKHIPNIEIIFGIIIANKYKTKAQISAPIAQLDHVLFLGTCASPALQLAVEELFLSHSHVPGRC